jgi:16S rRNA (cytosine1402-N4)-methyltransferase
MREYIRGQVLPKEIPIINNVVGQRLVQISKAMKASDAEVARNVRARSPMLRITEKIA